jgi:chloramphenicol 3-O-phosphotransferase
MMMMMTMMRKVSVVRIIKVGVRVVEKIGVARKSRRGERTTTTRTMNK